MLQVNHKAKFFFQKFPVRRDLFTMKRSYGQNNQFNRQIVLMGIFSLAAYLAVQIFSVKEDARYQKEMLRAARSMEKAISVITAYCDSSGIEINERLDPNRTGLIGEEFSPITTTLGHPDAKRTTTNPDMAGLIVHLLHKTGVTAGDTIAIGSSASFPALLIASLTAAEAMSVYPVVIISLGSSSYGANRPEFNLLDLYKLLLHKNIITTPPAAISLGGEEDVGGGFTGGIKEKLLLQIRASGLPFILEKNLQKNVAKRSQIYAGKLNGNRIKAFINCGGSYANLGSSSLILNVKPGLNAHIRLPSVQKRGVLFAMAARGIPTIHLLFIRGLAVQYNLPWDPVPLPKPGSAKFYRSVKTGNSVFIITVFAYFAGLVVLMLHGIKKRE